MSCRCKYLSLDIIIRSITLKKGMNMKLNVGERLTLVQVLSAIKTDILTWAMVETVNLNLGLKDKEFKEFGINQIGGQVAWNQKGAQGKEIEIGEKVTEIIIEELNKLNDAKPKGLLEQRHVSLYRKFVMTETGKEKK